MGAEVKDVHDSMGSSSSFLWGGGGRAGPCSAGLTPRPLRGSLKSLRLIHGLPQGLTGGKGTDLGPNVSKYQEMSKNQI